MSVADTAVGAILEIPPALLQDIKKAEAAIKSLQATSETASRKIKGHFDNTAVSGLNAFIKKIQEAQNKVGRISLPNLNSSGFATSVSQIAQSLAAIDRASITGAKRLGKIVDAVSGISIAQPFADMLKEIANGIVAIGNTSQQTIANVSQLAQSMAQLAKDIRTVQNAQRTQANDTASVAQYNKLYKEQASLVRQKNELERKGSSITAEESQRLYAIKQRYAEITRQIIELNRKKQNAATVLAQITGQQNVSNVSNRTTVSGAIDYAKQAKSLKELQDAYKNLKSVMSTIDPRDSKWAEANRTYQETKRRIDEIRKSMGELQTQSVRVAGVTSQLRNQIAAVFSISAIMGYIRKMVDVRAEFELQNVALRAILQNKDEADKIFMQVQQMAMQSPFSVLQMTTFTKQLAAYRIESEKLVGTTKMLADVSAGLGVDMSRLILAYGQVKSANYLRATEIRQFTEAGLNIAGELANYFSELQGKMISVGDVMDMVTKRMVRFEDVEEVFKRVTSAGGLFYDMQKKQSETLRGQLQRIQDAYSIMMNEIGKSNQGIISRALTLIRQLISGWREIIPLVYAFGAAFAVGAITRGLLSVVLSLKNVVTLLRTAKTAQDAWNIAAQKNVWGAVLSIITAIVVELWAAKSASSALAEELDRIRFESASDLKESIADFSQLAKTATDTTKSYTEQKEALDALNRSYKDILPSYMLEYEWLQKNIGNYDAAIAKIQEYFQAKEMQKQVDTILNSEDYTKAVKDMQELGEDLLGKGIFDATVTKKYTDAWMQQIASEIASGKIENSAQAVGKRLSEIFGKDVIITDGQFKKAKAYFENLSNEINNITLGTAGAKDQTELYAKELERLSTGQLQERIENAKKEMESLNKQIALIQSTHDFDFERKSGIDASLIAQNEQRLTSLQEKYTELTQSVAQYEQAMATAWAKEKSEEINETIGKLQTEITKVSELTRQRDELARTDTGTAEESDRLEKLNKDLDNATKKTLGLAYGMGVDLEEAELLNIDNMFDLERLLNKVAEEAYPKLAKAAVAEVGKGETAIKSLVDKVDWLKKAINSFSEGLGFGTVFEDVLTETDTKAEEAAKQVNVLKKIESKRNEDYIKDAAKRAGIDEKLITARANLVRSAYQSDKDYSKELRSQAKVWKDQKEAVDDMTEAQRKFYFEKNKLSQATVDELAKAAVAAEDIANAYDPEAVKKTKGRSGRGTDPWIEIFKERSKAIQDFYKQYETVRDKFSESESQRRNVASFESYFESVGLNMADVISKGWDTRGLVGNIEQLQSDLKKHFGAIYDDAEKIMRKGITLDVVENPTSEQKLTYALAKLIHDLEKQSADNKVKIDFEMQDNALERMKKDFSDVFANYELTKELGNIGVNVELSYMVGGKPTSLAQARKDLQDTYNKAVSEGNVGKDAEKEFKSTMDKLAGLEHKAQVARLKNYIKYLTESMGERAQIEIKSIQDVNKIREDETLDTFSKEQAIMQRRKKMQEDLSKFDLGELKGSDVYLTVFKDLENASKEQLQYVINKFKELQSTFKDLSPAQVKSIANEIKRMEDALAGKDSVKNIFANLRDSINYARKRNDLLKEQVKWQNQINDSEQTLSDAQVDLNNLQLKLNSIQDQNSEEWVEANDAVMKQQSFVAGLQSQIEYLKKKLAEVTGEIEKGESAWESWKKGIGNIRQAMSQLKDSFDSVFTGLDSIGLVNDAFRDTYESIGDIVGGLDTFLGGLESISITNPFSIITGSIKAMGGILQTIGGAFGIGDKKKERDIQKLVEKVDTLDKAYQRLEKSIEAAYAFSDYKAGYTQMQNTLNAEKIAYEELLALEKSKKKTDKEKVKEYEEALEEIAEKQKELQKSLIEDFGSTTDYRGVAEDFVSAWLDAFKETGDGLDALNENWQDFIQNLFIKQAALAKAGDVYKDVIDIINNAMSKGKTDFALKEAIAEAQAATDKGNEYMNEYLKALAEAFNIRPNASGELILSDLQKGIQNITEPQAAAIEAYLNSMRFAVFRHTEQLDTLIATIQSQYGSGAENPVVTELKGIRGVLDSINSKFDSIIGRNGSQRGIRIASN